MTQEPSVIHNIISNGVNVYMGWSIKDALAVYADVKRRDPKVTFESRRYSRPKEVQLYNLGKPLREKEI